ncbi:LOW QUALITY PROTEIN: uncharacterized protein LOC111062600 [Nilaparvata lugens]|uniref:LOW QUALITY PROTEIN: uncharacterized protein LOC111062600 n=1 Tax=Nilaparvata lugens TaxID=108931 RepID=UPI00193D4404|nr:LOW QUALITY PROTEIN: uncharacterized protein LOC111062600 [Nilaparvata lugens]
MLLQRTLQSTAGSKYAHHRSISFPYQGIVPLSLVGFALMMSVMPGSVSSQNYLTALTARRDRSPYKGFSGVRARPDSARMVYYHDQTIAVVEIGAERELFNCELIETYKPKQQTELLSSLKVMIGRPVEIRLDQMLDLMDQCYLLETPDNAEKAVDRATRGSGPNPSTLLSGILPGTKWCGSGDIAETYYDLGTETDIDKCCRNHDICPSKVRPKTVRYNMTNNSPYTKSHCSCDYKFMQCLKATNKPTANVMGTIYFNLLKVPCVNTEERKFQSTFKY